VAESLQNDVAINQVEAPLRRSAMIACLLPAAYFLFMAVFAVVHHEDFASETPQFLRYVFFPAVIGGLLLAGAMLMPTRVGLRIGTCVIAILAGCFAFEALMTVRVFTILLGYFGAGESSALNTGGAADGLPPGYTVKRLNRALETRELPMAMLSGLPHSNVLLCWQAQKPILYKADRYGFNNPDEVYDAPLDLAIIGDSFIEGICQPPGMDVVSQLRSTHPASVALASRGSGPLFELAVLGRFGKNLRPRHVIVAFFEGNDWENLQHELTLPWLRQGLSQQADFGQPTTPSETLTKAASVLTAVRRDAIAPVEVLLKTRIVRNFLALNQTMTQLGLSYPKASPDLPEFADVLHRAKEITNAWGGQLTILYIPQSVRYIGVLPRQFVYDRLRHKVLAAADAAGIDIIDLVELFGKEADPASFYAPDAHFSERGAAFTAAAISNRTRLLTLKQSHPWRHG
jgi:SGNH hydrolase-like domain, acetyltransferase AlgX